MALLYILNFFLVIAFFHLLLQNFGAVAPDVYTEYSGKYEAGRYATGK
jgi:type IV secretory pathway TrbL component